MMLRCVLMPGLLPLRRHGNPPCPTSQSRSLHENGLKHQGNKERALRQLYKTGEHAKRDKEHERRMMERIERVRQGWLGRR